MLNVFLYQYLSFLTPYLAARGNIKYLILLVINFEEVFFYA